MNRKAHVFIKIAWITGIVWTFFSTFLAGLMVPLVIIDIVIPAVPSLMLLEKILDTISMDAYNNWSTNHFSLVCIFTFIFNGLIVAGLTFGVFKKNRACAIILFLHPVSHIVSSLVIRGLYWGHMFWNPQTVFFLIFSVFAVLLFIGVWGTFSYHKAAKSIEAQ